MLSQTTIASVNDIETSLKSCLKNCNGSLEMSYCAEEASSKTELEIRQLLINNSNNFESLQENQQLWNEYKKSVKTAISAPLLQAMGWDYVLFAAQNIYIINLNRLKLLSYLLENKSYISEDHKTLLKIDSSMSTLSKKMTKEEYKNLIGSQTSWEKYKNNLSKLLDKYGNSKKEEVLKDLYYERELQLWSLELIPRLN